MINPLQNHYDQCNDSDSETKHRLLADGPHLVDIEPVGLCNFRCTMCPTGLGALGRPSGFMSTETHKNILEKTELPMADMRYIGWGEPTLHPDLPAFINTAAHGYGRLTHINTNGSRLTKGLARELVSCGLASIKFSFQGTDRESYFAMRRMDFFDGLIEAISYMKEARGDGCYPYIAVSTTTTDETPEMVQKFKDKVFPLVDHLGIGKTIFEFIDMAAVPKKQRDRLEKAASLATVIKKHPSPCPEVYDKLSIHWNGNVVTCCNDYSDKNVIGDINLNSMAQIWRHPKMEMYRAALAKNDYSLPLCESCFDYLGLTDGMI